jgi:flavorubredoxin
MSNVLVMFQADTEHTEQMALAVGVGAVEAEANIRLRRLAAPGAVEVAHKGYGRLQAADLLWANLVVIGLESPTPKTEELGGLLALLGEIDASELKGKQAWTFNPESSSGTSESQDLVESALRTAGIKLLRKEIPIASDGEDLMSQMKAVGRSLANRSLDSIV